MFAHREYGMTRSGGLRLAIFIAVIVLIGVIYVAGARHWLSVDSLRTHRDALQQFVAEHYWKALLLAAIASVALVAISVPVSGVLMLLCGMVFGRWVGSAVMVVSASLGATLAMLMARYLIQDFIRARIHRYRRAQELLDGFERHPDSYLLFLRVAPGFPFWLSNILLGLTGVSAMRFLLLTLVGMGPDALIYCNVGANLATVRSAHDLLSPASILGLALLAILCLSPAVIYELERRKLLRPGWPFHHSRSGRSRR
jgi:uncharacterized membrane protein YdjX (TVP38/TMEM64 family)